MHRRTSQVPPVQGGPAATRPRPESSRQDLHPLLAAVAVCSLGLFVLVAALLAQVPEQADVFDQTVTRFFLGLRRPALNPLVSRWTGLGSWAGLSVLTVVLAGTLALRQMARQAAFTVLTMATAGLLATVLKILFARQRPPLEDLLGPPSLTHAFPSGHSLGTAAFACTLLCLAWLGGSTGRRQAGAATAAAVFTLTVGASRVYLGYHWPTDVLAGWSLGVTWPCALLLALVGWRRYRPRQQPTQPDAPDLAQAQHQSGAPGAQS